MGPELPLPGPSHGCILTNPHSTPGTLHTHVEMCKATRHTCTHTLGSARPQRLVPGRVRHSQAHSGPTPHTHRSPPPHCMPGTRPRDLQGAPGHPGPRQGWQLAGR